MTRFVLVTGWCFAIGGCNAVAGINDPIDADGGSAPSTSGGPAPSANVDAFLGSWQTPSSNQAVTAGCNAAGAATLPPRAITLVLTKGSATDTIVITPADDVSCHIEAQIVGNVATALAGQTCTFSFQDGEVDTYEYTTDTTFTIGSSNASQAEVRISARLSIAPQGGVCRFAEASTYDKIGGT